MHSFLSTLNNNDIICELLIIFDDLIKESVDLNDYNHGWIQTKKDNTGYFYFLSFKNPT